MTEFSEHKFPIRTSVMTYNVWGNNLWPDRQSALCQAFSTSMADIIMLQEVTPDIIDTLDKLLSNYGYVQDMDVPGWQNESNIYWNKDLFALVDSGYESLHMPDYPHRGLFWVRLCLQARPDIKLFVITVHYPWKGCLTEVSTGKDQRRLAAIESCHIVRRLMDTRASESDVLIFGGDFNDDLVPVSVLREGLGLEDVYEATNSRPPTTHPTRPSHPSEERQADHTLDWIMTLFPYDTGRVISAQCMQNRGGGFPPASDHMPVLAVCELRKPSTM